jgi:hypothetical protein
MPRFAIDLLSPQASIMSNLAGDAPGVDSLIESVKDQSARSLFRFLVRERESQAAVAAERHNELVAMISNVSMGLAQAHTDIGDIKSRFNNPPPHPVSLSGHVGAGFPLVINAQSGSSGKSSLSSRQSGSSSSKRSKSSHSPDGPLACPFCPSRHSSEKVHVQHMNRILNQ